MDSLRKEIEAELKRTRLDKGRLYELLLKIVDNSATGGAAGPAGPAGPTGDVGPTGPAGPAGPACVCKCVSSKPVIDAKKAPLKKKVVSA